MYKNFKLYFEKHKRLKTILNYLYTFLIFFLICLPAIIINFSMNYPMLYDELEFFVPSIYSNHFMPFSFNVGRDARFLPFQMLDYNLVLLFPDSFSKFHLVHQFLNLKFILFIFCLYYCSKYVCELYKVKFSRFIFFCLTLSYITVKLFLFCTPVFSEITIAILFLVFIVIYLKAKIKQSKSLYIVSFFLMFYITYCKEIAFAIFFPLAFGNLIFNRKKITKLDKIFYYSIILNAVIFFVSYVILLNYLDRYDVYYNVNKLKSIKEYITYIEKVFKNNNMLYICLLIYLYNIYKVLCKKDKYFDLHLLSLSGFVYAICSIILILPGFHYFSLSCILLFPMMFLIIGKIKYKKIVYVLFALLICYSVKECCMKIYFSKIYFEQEKNLYDTLAEINKTEKICCLKYENNVYNMLSYVNNSWKNEKPKYYGFNSLKTDGDDCDIYLKMSDGKYHENVMYFFYFGEVVYYLEPLKSSKFQFK